VQYLQIFYRGKLLRYAFQRIWLHFCHRHQTAPTVWCSPLLNKKHLKNVGPIHHASRRTPIQQVSLPVLSRTTCTSMSTTTTRDRGDCYGPMEWAQSVCVYATVSNPSETYTDFLPIPGHCENISLISEVVSTFWVGQIIWIFWNFSKCTGMCIFRFQQFFLSTACSIFMWSPFLHLGFSPSDSILMAVLLSILTWVNYRSYWKKPLFSCVLASISGPFHIGNLFKNKTLEIFLSKLSTFTLDINFWKP